MEYNKLTDWFNESRKDLLSIIGEYLNEVEGNEQKTRELCHIGKFIMLLDEPVSIFKLTESPDFLLNTEQGTIGLEHLIIVDQSLKKVEGYFETIIKRVEQNLLIDSNIPNFFANCDIIPLVNYSLSDKHKIIDTVTNVFKEYILHDKYVPNPYVRNIRLQKYSSKGINIRSYKLGEPLTSSVIKQAIISKEKKYSQYSINCKSPIWLLLVTGNLKSSSYNVEDIQQLNFSDESNFDRIYLLDDFKGNLYRFK